MLKRLDFKNPRIRLVVLAVLMLLLIGIMVATFLQSRGSKQVVVTGSSKSENKETPAEPKLTISEVLSGLSHPWDTVFLPDGTQLFNERSGLVSRIKDGKKAVIADISDVYAVGEGGLTGLALDSKFAENRFIYTCFNARTAGGLDVRLVRWQLSEDNASLTNRNDIVTGIPSNPSGRHSGCRMRVDSVGNIWIGTGDAARASNPQDPKNLGGKILHVTRDGMPAGNNLPAPFDPRIFSYGHRNVQGIVLFEKPVKDVYGYSVEHGSNRDDEVNLLKSGNFGWAPRITYVEVGVPMTDLTRFPNAVSAVWSSGSPTIAPSGAAQLKGEQWGTWDGAIAVAVLKGRQVKLFWIDGGYNVAREETILTEFGRVRSVTQGIDGSLYLTTDNGSNDKIIKVTPSH